MQYVAVPTNYREKLQRIKQDYTELNSTTHYFIELPITSQNITTQNYTDLFIIELQLVSMHLVGLHSAQTGWARSELCHASLYVRHEAVTMTALTDLVFIIYRSGWIK